MDQRKQGANAYKKTMNPEDNSKKQDELNKTPKRINQQSSSGFIKKTGLDQAQIGALGKALNLSEDAGKPSVEEIAKYLIVLGSEQSAEILKHLPEEIAEQIVAIIAQTPQVKKSEVDPVLYKLNKEIEQLDRGNQGGSAFAKELLELSLGKEKAQVIAEKVLPEYTEPPFDFLHEFDPVQVKNLIYSEQASLQAFILGQLDRTFASKIISALDQDQQTAVIRQMALNRKLDQALVQQIEETLKNSMKNQARFLNEQLEGVSVLAEIVKHLDPSQERVLLEDLELESPDLAQELKEELFTIDTVLQLEDRSLQQLLRELRNDQICLLLKGKEEKIRVKILENLSEGRRVDVAQEYHYLGPVPRKEVDQATRDFLLLIRKKEELGEIVVQREGNDYI
jgi:flagellar motor switch protein FliG